MGQTMGNINESEDVAKISDRMWGNIVTYTTGTAHPHDLLIEGKHSLNEWAR
jgi:hypothetical protein